MVDDHINGFENQTEAELKEEMRDEFLEQDLEPPPPPAPEPVELSSSLSSDVPDPPPLQEPSDQVVQQEAPAPVTEKAPTSNETSEPVNRFDDDFVHLETAKESYA